MISFIVIGRNEGWKLEKCLSSIQDVVKHYKINNYEIIYVDSDSKDDSVEFAKQFQDLQVLKLVENFNAAIARNVGVEYSNGDILFFLDGDMEIVISEFRNLFDESFNKLVYPFVSGDFLNYYYKDSVSNILISKSVYHNIKKISIEVTTGGLFAIERSLWFKAGGMRNEFRRSQDLDLGLRLAKIGVPLKRLPILLVNHHTVKYTDKNRFWEDLKKGNFLYRGLLIRKNLFNKNIIKRILFREVTIYAFVISLFLFIFSLNCFYFLLFFAVTFIKVIRRSKHQNIPQSILQSILIDLNTIASFVFFYPKVKPYKIIEVKVNPIPI